MNLLSCKVSVENIDLFPRYYNSILAQTFVYATVRKTSSKLIALILKAAIQNQQFSDGPNVRSGRVAVKL